MKMTWLTDLHLERVDEKRRLAFYDTLKKSGGDAIVITGDISNAQLLPTHLLELGRSCSPRPVYFVLGNHDFYGSCFADVDRDVARVCAGQSNLRHLGHGETIPLGGDAALIGHRGWADGRSGWGASTSHENPDANEITDLRGMSNQAQFKKMNELGMASGVYFRETLPYALQCYRHVLIATHVPPFTSAVYYNGKPCDKVHQPFYSNISAGGVIRGIAGHYRSRKVTVLCGHTHSGAVVDISDGLQVRAGSARPGWPGPQESIDLN